MYSRDTDVALQELEFERSPPFTDLIWRLFQLFRSLAIVNFLKRASMDLQPRNVADLEKLTDCKAVIQLMKSALERSEWPKACDKVAEDNYPREEIGEVDRGRLDSRT